MACWNMAKSANFVGNSSRIYANEPLLPRTKMVFTGVVFFIEFTLSQSQQFWASQTLAIDSGRNSLNRLILKSNLISSVEFPSTLPPTQFVSIETLCWPFVCSCCCHNCISCFCLLLCAELPNVRHCVHHTNAMLQINLIFSVDLFYSHWWFCDVEIFFVYLSIK